MTVLVAMPKYEAYKDSEVEWLENIPESWELKRLEVIGQFSKGGGFSKSDLTNIGVSAILYGDIYTKYERSIDKVRKKIPIKKSQQAVAIKKHDLLFTGSGETKEDIGKCVVYNSDDLAYAGGDIIIFRQNFYNSNFLSFYLNTRGVMEEKAKTSKGEIIVHTYASKLRKIIVPTPAIKEQNAIANFLDKKIAQIDEAMTINQKQIELLKECKQIIIKKTVTQGLDPNVPMRESGYKWLGKIPKHWKMLRVKHIFNLSIEPSEKNNDHELLSVYTDIGVKPRRELEERSNKASTTDGYWLVKKGDIVVNKLLAWMGAIGLSNYDGVTSPAYDILRPTKPIEGVFYHLLFRSDFCSAELKRHSRGIMDMRSRLYFDRFGVIEVPYPSLEEQTKIICYIEQEFSKIDCSIDLQQAQVKNLNEYKDTLINSAVTGKIKVPNIN